MIWISRTSSGLIIQRDAVEIAIEGAAVALALGPIIHELVDAGRALGLARREGYEAGLDQGYANAQIAAATRERIADRQAAELVEALAIGVLANAA